MTTTAPQASATNQQLLSTLDQQWYNALTQQLNPQGNFQAIQGAMAVQPNSNYLWRFFDAIPPLSISQTFNPSGYNSLFSAYSAVVNNLLPQTDNSMQTLLGDKYVSWDSYRRSHAPAASKSSSGVTDYVGLLVQMFETWALANIDAGMINAGVTLLQQSDVVTVAATMLRMANGVGAYTATYGALTNALQQKHGKSVSMNSHSQSADVSHAWASGSVSGSYDFFSGSAGGSWDQFNQQVSSSGLTINVQFGAVETLRGQPLATQQTLDPELDDAVPWWNSTALQVARQHNDNTVWKHGAPTWSDAFGPKGNLNRLTTGVVVVDGITSTLTTNFSVSSDDVTRIQGSMNAGFWPFFSASGAGGWNHSVQKNADGTATLTSTCPAGNPNILGVLVSPIDSVLSGG